ncbi:hypothetical protein HY989_06950 [Candidatus Micrarchaeota archaeon]|nr:hypothetical protein [Candidatus Micrarchaeota archaeon]
MPSEQEREVRENIIHNTIELRGMGLGPKKVKILKNFVKELKIDHENTHDYDGVFQIAGTKRFGLTKANVKIIFQGVGQNTHAVIKIDHPKAYQVQGIKITNTRILPADEISHSTGLKSSSQKANQKVDKFLQSLAAKIREEKEPKIGNRSAKDIAKILLNRK